MTGRFPNPEVHHKNHIRHDNRWCNLKKSATQKNHLDITFRSTIQRSCRRSPSPRKHHATIMVNQRRIHCGYYDSFDDACAARAAAEIKYGFGLMH
jgi:Drexlerviridae HNH endonuclease